MPVSRKTQQQMSDFSARLKLALEKRFVRIESIMDFVRAFQGNTKVTISYAAGRMWLNSEGIPSKRNLELLSDWLQITSDWLTTGHVVAPINPISITATKKTATPAVEVKPEPQFTHRYLLAFPFEVSMETMNIAMIVNEFSKEDRELIYNMVSIMKTVQKLD
jgi:hypothetical protein